MTLPSITLYSLTHNANNMMIEILAAKADDDIIIFGLVCAVLYTILKYKYYQKHGTVLFPKGSKKDSKKD